VRMASFFLKKYVFTTDAGSIIPNYLRGCHAVILTYTIGGISMSHPIERYSTHTPYIQIVNLLHRSIGGLESPRVKRWCRQKNSDLFSCSSEINQT
jgi:hypothetical protein